MLQQVRYDILSLNISCQTCDTSADGVELRDDSFYGEVDGEGD